MDAPNHAMTGALLRARLVTLKSMNRPQLDSLTADQGFGT
jgi:hypothetical protein